MCGRPGERFIFLWGVGCSKWRLAMEIRLAAWMCSLPAFLLLGTYSSCLAFLWGVLSGAPIPGALSWEWWWRLQGGACCSLAQSLLAHAGCVRVWQPCCCPAPSHFMEFGVSRPYRAEACSNFKSIDQFNEGFPLWFPFLPQVSGAREGGKALLRVPVSGRHWLPAGTRQRAPLQQLLDKSLSARGVQWASPLSCCFATAVSFLISSTCILM